MNLDTMKHNFEKERSIGDIFSDSFRFMKLEFNIIFIIVLIATIIFSAMSVSFDTIFTQYFSPEDKIYESLSNLIHGFGLILASLLFFSFIKSYLNQDDKVTFRDISTFLGSIFVKHIALSALVTLLLFIILIPVSIITMIITSVANNAIAIIIILALAIPMLIAAVYLQLTGTIYFLTASNISDSVKASYNYIKTRWWRTVGLNISLFLVLLAVEIILIIILIAITGIFFTTPELDTWDSFANLPYNIIQNSIITFIASLCSFFIAIFGIIASIHLYFSYKKEIELDILELSDTSETENIIDLTSETPSDNIEE